MKHCARASALALVVLYGACGDGDSSAPDGAASNDSSLDLPVADVPAADLAVADVPAADLVFDAASSDAPRGDAATDAASGLAPDAAVADAPIGDLLPFPDGLPGARIYLSLAETGLYQDFAARTLADGVRAFEPTHALWSDGAVKRRWIKLPPGTMIDTTDMDHWIFPVGTKVWKEFTRDGITVETRLIERTGVGSDDYWMGSFVWNTDHSDAVFAVDGQTNIDGTPHDAPAQKLCGACHRGDKGRILGFSAIQLSHPGDGLTLQSLAAAGLLTAPPPAGQDYPVPGDPVTARALGYLHANCGHCHNRNGTSWPDTQVVMRLDVAERTAENSQLFRTMVGQAIQYWRHPTITQRVAPGSPDTSAIIARMTHRGDRDQMPPLATEMTDPTGLDALSQWIRGLTP